MQQTALSARLHMRGASDARPLATRTFTAAARHTRRPLLVCRAELPPTQEAPSADSKEGNGAVAPGAAAAAAAAEPQQQPEQAAATSSATEPELVYTPPSASDKFWTGFKLGFALPWRRFKQDSVLTIKLEGAIAEQPQGRFSSTLSLPALCDCLLKAAYDPRIVGVVVKIDPLACGWGKLQEIRRHIEMFNESGKMSIAFMERAGEKEYYLASAFKEVYVPPSGYLSLRGFTVGGTFLRGVLDKVGVEPEVKRIGAYKSAGDQLLRKDMSDAQREQLTALLDDIYEDFVTCVARSRGKSREEVVTMLDEGIYDVAQFKEGGWVTDLKYEDEINDMLKPKTGGKEDEVAKVGFKRYSKVWSSTFPALTGKKRVAVIRTAGAIVGGKGMSGSTITAPEVIAQLRRAKKDKKIAAVVLRVDSGGGDALASDLMWREIQLLSKEKPVVASMSDVAASGGYYMSMGASKIVAEPLTVTGSIGVVTGKFNLSDLYQRVGYSKELISRGKYAQLMSENKPLTPEEEVLFDASAQHAYASFRDKAAASRGMAVEAMQAVAQGRVWSGRRAVQLGLVDALGGLRRALALAKEAAGIPREEGVRLVEYSRAKASPLALLSGGGAAAVATSSPLAVLGWVALRALGGGPAAGASVEASLGAPLLLGPLLQQAGALAGQQQQQQVLAAGGGGMVQAVMAEGVEVQGVGSAALLAAAQVQAQAGGTAGAGLSLEWALGEEGEGLFD